MALARAFADAGLPPGVLNLVLGGTAELGRSLVEDPDIVFVVAGDCDVRRAAEVACESAFGESGQKCTASGLVVVDARRGDRFLSEIETILAGLAMGDGADPGIDLGPLVDLAAVDRAGILVDEAVEPGATIELSGCGRTTASGDGYFFAPRVVRLPGGDSPLKRQETFARQVPAGLVNVNLPTTGVEYQAPFGGWNMSGGPFAEAGGRAHHFYTRSKTVAVSGTL